MIGRVVCVCFVLVAGGLFFTAAAMHPTPVTAVPVAATAQAGLTARECADGRSLPVSFRWNGAVVTELEEAPKCEGGVTAGSPGTVYVASNDASNVGPDANWILNPDTHDPFDFIGPNGLRGFVFLVGFLPLSGALLLLVRERKRRPRVADRARQDRMLAERPH